MIQRLCVCLCALFVAVSPAAAQEFERGWVDLNFGTAAAAEKTFTSAFAPTVSSEPSPRAVAYGLPRGGSFDVGGGYMFTRLIGVGVSLAGTAHEDTAGLAISIPHPNFFNASASDATTTEDTLSRGEGAWHLHAMLVAANTPRFRVRVFGGPSYFRAEQDVVTSIKYDQLYQVFSRGNAVDITSYTTEASVGTGWGLHAGVDAAVFFNRIVGIGALLRVSRGTVEIDDYGGTHDVRTGGVQFGAGLRLKF